ncbi:NF-kappa-B-repressing factor [Drosophila erecta]|uniref:GG16918 n=1 Tax=Drosophila erecta TaxID=7220 RepID=B3P0V4_DROER|nr:NF-kappa-B-repressing factor [Drosophila erecta]EDV49002.1 uncharacterized protein Dere_GG16918 [Drosophila erecta]
MSVKPKRQKVENEGEELQQKQKKNKAKKQQDAGYGSGEFSLEWDVDSYKTEYESDEHWDLRRSFMLAHKDRFEEDRLVCLAQTFVNMEFMGCKYPSATMLLVAELSKEIAADFRQKREQRLKRTFVSASDAAEQRAKGRRGAPVPSAGSSKESLHKERQCFGGGDPVDLYQDLRFGHLIVYLAGGRNCLQNSCNIANVKYEERASLDQVVSDNTKYAELLVNNEVIATGQGETLKAAKMAAHKQACLALQSHCYSIKLNASRDTIKVEKNKDGVNVNVTKESADNQLDSKLDASNKGYHMMRLMGWTGGGLGRLKQGREEPVCYLLKNNRNGLGLINPQKNLADYRRLIENYVGSDDIRDMQFEPTFSKEERTMLHQIARQFGLRSTSYGSGESRRLLITKKISYGQILTEVLFRRNPKFCERYFVHVPMQKAHLFPGHVADLELENVCE